MAVKDMKDMGASVLARLKSKLGKKESIIKHVCNSLCKKNFSASWKCLHM